MNTQFQKTFVAIEAVLYIACRCGTVPVCSRDICAYQGVTLRYLEQILQCLVHHTILKGVRGPKGGYLLAKDRRKISLQDIYHAVMDIKRQQKQDAATPSELHTHTIHPLIEQTESAFENMLATQTIQDLYEEIEANNSSLIQKKSDFTI